MTPVPNIFDFRPQIEAALRHSGGTHEFEDVVEGVRAGRMQMWANGPSVAITEIVVYPRKRMLNVFLAGGRRAELLGMLDDAARWGRAQGCAGMSMAGRRGWLRVLDKRGFRPTLTVMEMTL